MKSYSYANGKFDRTIVVGDIHGCYVELVRSKKSAELQKTEREHVAVTDTVSVSDD